MNGSIRSIISVLIVASSLLWVGLGCVKVDATVNMDRDGSGTLRVIYGMPTYVTKQAELARQLSRSLDLAAGKTNVALQDLDIPFQYDPVVLNAEFAAMAKEGITLDSMKAREQGGWNYIDFTLKFETLEALFKQPFFRDFGVVFKHLDEKSCKLTVSLPAVGNSPEIANVVTQESLNRLTPFYNGFRVVARLGVPGEIRNSNSMVSDNRRATWEWDFDKDSQALAHLAQDKIIIVFDASEVRIRDFEKPVDTVSSVIK